MPIEVCCIIYNYLFCPLFVHCKLHSKQTNIFEIGPIFKSPENKFADNLCGHIWNCSGIENLCKCECGHFEGLIRLLNTRKGPTTYRVSRNWVFTLFWLFSRLPVLVQRFILPFFNSPGDNDSKTNLTFLPTSKIEHGATKFNVKQLPFPFPELHNNKINK